MEWVQIASDFQWDGSLRDIYIRGTSAGDWEEVWSILTAGPEPLIFLVDGEEAALPASAHDLFQLKASHSLTASYRLGKQTLNCHFFSIEEIEFDLDPRAVDGPAEADRLATFMAALGRACSKEVLLTMENVPEAVLARFDPMSNEVIGHRLLRDVNVHFGWKADTTLCAGTTFAVAAMLQADPSC